MACNNCNDTGAAPPAGFTPSTGAPSGQSTSYGGSTTVQARTYGTSCPTPLTSSQVTRTPYCPSWVDTLFGSYVGKLIIKVGSCLHFLRSAANGWIRYDAATESVSVDSAPPFASNNPSGAQFGYLAKTIPTISQRFDETLGVCVSVGTQEIGSQVLDERSDGMLIVGNRPVSGELPVLQSADSANQTRFDYVDPLVAEDQPSVDTDIGFLASVPTTRNSGGQSYITSAWMRVKKFRLRKSQWGEASSPEEKGAARQAVFVPVSGGTTGDGALELRYLDAPPSDAAANFPSTKSQDDTLFYNDPNGIGGHAGYGLGWVAYPRGKGMHLMPLTAIINSATAAGQPDSGQLIAGTGDQLRTAPLDAYPAVPNGTIGITLRIKITCVAAHAVSVAVASTLAGSYTVVASHLGVANDLVSYSDVLVAYTPAAFTDEDSLFFKIVRSGTTTLSTSTKVDVYLVAYHI